MTEYLKNNPIALRACVLYEFLKSRQECTPRSSISIYRDVCKVIGDDAMKYSEFDFWYHRFLNREFDLNFEMDRDKKIYELTDMPIVVMENIVKNLDFFDRLPLERTSRSLRTFIMHQKQSIRAVQFDVQNHKTGVQLSEITDRDYYDDGWIWKFRPSRQNFRRAYWEEATRGLKKILKYPKLHLDTLQACFMWDDRKLITFSSNLWQQFDTPTHQLHLKKLDVKVVSVKILSKLLTYFTPGYLETININTSEPSTTEELEELVGLEQWKQAKYFSFKNQRFVGPLRHLYHFKEFNVRLASLYAKDIREMKEILFKSPDFEKCSLAFNLPVNIGREFGDDISGSTNIYHYQIPDSNQYFEIIVRMQNIEISRKNK